MKGKTQKITPYVFIAPHIILFIIFLIIPTIIGICISFFDWDYLTPPKFIGFGNYAKLFNPKAIDHKQFLFGMQNTIKFVLVTVPINVVLSLVISTMLNDLKRGKNTIRALFYFPVVLSVTCVATTWSFLGNKETGVINYYLTKFFNIEALPWLTREPYLLSLLVIMTIWWTIGRNILFFAAGLTDIPPQLYEAAEMDGANKLQQFIHVTIPGIMRVLLFVIVIETIAQFNVFGQMYLVAGTEINNIKSARVALMVIRETAFKQFRMGMASAMALILGLFIIIFSVIQFRLFMNPSDRIERGRVELIETKLKGGK